MRLKDIEVDEVSLVDKAANKRKFAFMKRDNTDEHKEAEKNDEVKEAEQNIAVVTPVTDEPTAEEVEAIEKLLKEINDLTVQVQKGE